MTGLAKNRCKNGDFYWVSAYSPRGSGLRELDMLMISEKARLVTVLERGEADQKAEVSSGVEVLAEDLCWSTASVPGRIPARKTGREYA